jgi:hypothetical protein
MSSNNPITVVSIGEWEIPSRVDDLLHCISEAYLNAGRFLARYDLLESGQRIGLSMRGEIFRTLALIYPQHCRGEYLYICGDKAPVVIDDTLPKMEVAPGLYRSDIVFVLLDAQEGMGDGRE